MGETFESSYWGAEEEAPLKNPDRAELVSSLVQGPLFAELLDTFDAVSLGGRNLERLEELIGDVPRGVSDREDSMDTETAYVCPVLPFLRSAGDLADKRLVMVLRGDTSARVKTVVAEDLCFRPGYEEMDIVTEDPYVTITTDITNPALIAEADFEMMKNQVVGSGHKGVKGLYWRLALLGAFYRFSPHEFTGETAYSRPGVVFSNINTLSRQCEVPLRKDILKFKISLM